MGSGPQSACGYASSIADLFSMFFRSLFACVCVCLCNICIDVKPNLFYFFFSPSCGGTQHFTGTVSNEATSETGYPAWPAGRTCNPSMARG